MKGKLILSGGGDLKISYNLDEEFFSLLKNNAKILYIPIALKRDRIGFEACYDWFSNIIATHAKDKDIDFSMILEHDSIPDLKNYDCVYCIIVEKHRKQKINDAPLDAKTNEMPYSYHERDNPHVSDTFGDRPSRQNSGTRHRQ